MSKGDHLFTCELCGEGGMSETAMKTHMYIAHVYNEVSCMFCDLRGVTAEEMTVHINSVHCSDDSHNNDASHNGLQQRVNNVQLDIENRSKSNIQTTRLPVPSVHCDLQSFVHLVDSNAGSGQTFKPDASDISTTPNHNAETDSQRVLSRESPGNECKINRDKQQKRELSGTSVASNLPKTAVANGLDEACHGDRFVHRRCEHINY